MRHVALTGMAVADPLRYQVQLAARNACPWLSWALYEAVLPGLLFGAVGAVAWAIRGSGGYGGIDGTIVPGMAWGLLWYYLCLRKGIDARGAPLWLGLGIAVGGELGYGQYVSWIQGNFQYQEGILPVSKGQGYLWFTICGIGWGAPGGIALGWALSARVSVRRWLFRLMAPLGLALLGWGLVCLAPQYFFPNYGMGIYAELDGNLKRTIYTNTQNFTVLAWWLGAILVALIQRDRVTLTLGLLIGGGFGIGFTLGALWCLGYTYAPGYIDWWKVWELQAGFNLGLLYALGLYWAVRQVDRAQPAGGSGGGLPPPIAAGPRRARDIALTLSIFLFLYILFHGASWNTGVIFGFYENAVDQYAFPPGRKAIFSPVALLLIAWAAIRIRRILRPPPEPSPTRAIPVSERMMYLIVLLAIVGVVTIWPSKIAVLYMLLLAPALFSLNRLNAHFDAIDSRAPEA